LDCSIPDLILFSLFDFYLFYLFSLGTSAAADGSKVSLFDPSAVLNKAVASSYLFQDGTAGDDSLFSKPQKGLTPR
jgi:hypothetical protein